MRQKYDVRRVRTKPTGDYFPGFPTERDFRQIFLLPKKAEFCHLLFTNLFWGKAYNLLIFSEKIFFGYLFDFSQCLKNVIGAGKTPPHFCTVKFASFVH